MLRRGAWLWLLFAVASVNATPVRENNADGHSRYEYDVKHPSGSSRVKVLTGSNSGGRYSHSGHQPDYNSRKPYQSLTDSHANSHRPLSSGYSQSSSPHRISEASRPSVYAESRQSQGHAPAASHLYPTFDVYSKYPANRGYDHGHSNNGYSYPHEQSVHGPFAHKAGPQYGSGPYHEPNQYQQDKPLIQQTSHDLPHNFETANYKPHVFSQIPVGVQSFSSEGQKSPVVEQVHIDKSLDFSQAEDSPVGISQGYLPEPFHERSSQGFTPETGPDTNQHPFHTQTQTIQQELLEQAPVVQTIDNPHLSQNLYEPTFSDISKPRQGHSGANQPNYQFVPIGEPYEKFSHSTEIKHPPVLLQPHSVVPQQQVLIDLAGKTSHSFDDSLATQKHIDANPSLSSIPNYDNFPPLSHDHAIHPAQHSLKSPYPSYSVKQPHHIPQPIKSSPTHYNEIPHPSQELVHDRANPSLSQGIKTVVPQTVKLPPPPPSQELVHDIAISPPAHSIKTVGPQSVKLPPPSQELVQDIVILPPSHAVKTHVPQSVKLPPPPLHAQELVHDELLPPPSHSVKTAAPQSVKLTPPPSQELVHDIALPPPSLSVKTQVPKSVKLSPPPLHSQELVHHELIPPPSHSVKTAVPQSVKLPPPSQELVHDIALSPPAHSIKTVVPQSVKLPPPPQQALVHDTALPPPLHTVKTVVPQTVKLPPPPPPSQELVHDIALPPPSHATKTVVPQSVKLSPPPQKYLPVGHSHSPHEGKTLLISSNLQTTTPEHSFEASSPHSPLTDASSVKVPSSTDGVILENSLLKEPAGGKSPSISTSAPSDASVPNLFAGVPSPSGLDDVSDHPDGGNTADPASLPVPEALVSGPNHPSDFYNSGENRQHQRFPDFPVESALKQQDPVADKVSDLSQGYRSSAGYDSPNHRRPDNYDGPSHGRPDNYDGPNHGRPVDYDDEEPSSPDVNEARLEVDRISKEIGSSFGLRLPGFK